MANDDFDLSTLSNHLWESPNILRGPDDAADFKKRVFPLLFFKRISDVYDEEIFEALDESRGDHQYALFSENHRFQIPDDYHRANVWKKTVTNGQGLQRAMREIEDAKAKAALTELFQQVKDAETSVSVERIVADIDDIVRMLRFPGWQQTSDGEREVQKSLRRTLLECRLHKNQDLFGRAYGCIRQYY